MEAPFSRMNDIIDRKSNRMGIETYSRIMNVKYSLQTKTNSELYKRSDPLHDPVDKNVLFYLQFPCQVQKENSREETNS